jgi:predicted N-acyltransferase
MPSASPIFFVGLGLTRVGYNMVRRMMDDGLFVNLGIFPAVPETCTGIRFTLTLHHTFADIDRLVERLAYHLPKALQEEGRSVEDIHRAFRSVYRSRDNERPAVPEKTKERLVLERPSFQLHHKTTILDVSKPLWNSLLGNKGAFDWDNLALMEDSFRDNDRPEDNWNFHYYIVTDPAGKPVLATFFTSLIIKNDMLASAAVTLKIEEQRKEDFYYLTTRTLMMGSIITEGQHLYLDYSNPHWRNALMVLLDAVWAEQDKEQANAIHLRDFAPDDVQLRDFFVDQGFVKVDLPDSHVIHNPPYDSFEAYLTRLNKKKRWHVNRDAVEKSEWFEVKKIENPAPVEADQLYGLYENVYNRRKFNTFKLPRKFFDNILCSPHWDVLALTLKPEHDARSMRTPVGVSFAYRNANYNPMLIGLDYDYQESAKVYKQSVFRIIARAIELKSEKIDFGITASVEKRKFGAVIRPQVAYVQLKDNFDMSQVSMQSSV